MRRTYKSKKESNEGLNRRDVLLSLDDKSSLFDAFYIQNIKQSKREISSTNASNTYAIASSKMRKRKSKKRNKEAVVSPILEYVSASGYLTPNKSIHVKKAPDLFDLLFDSPNLMVPRRVSPRVPRDDSFDKVLSHKTTKKYRKRPPKVKNLLRFSKESDKENSQLNNDSTKNTTDILTYDLVVEKEPKANPPKFEDSIYKMLQHKSLFNNLQNNSNKSIKNRCYKNRLTENFQSPLFAKSSTPFIQRQKSKPLFQLSPITLDFSKNLKSDSSLEGNNDAHIPEKHIDVKKTPIIYNLDSKPLYSGEDRNSVASMGHNDINIFKNIKNVDASENNKKSASLVSGFCKKSISLDKESKEHGEAGFDQNRKSVHSIEVVEHSITPNSDFDPKGNVSVNAPDFDGRVSISSVANYESVILKTQHVNVKQDRFDINLLINDHKRNSVITIEDHCADETGMLIENNGNVSPIPLALNLDLSASGNENQLSVDINSKFTNRKENTKEKSQNKEDNCAIKLGEVASQISEYEPFLGFSCNREKITDISVKKPVQDNSVIKMSTIEYTVPSEAFLGFTNIESQISISSDSSNSQDLFNSVHTDTSESSAHKQWNNSLSSKNKSSYDTCNSDDEMLFGETEANVKSPLVLLKRLEDSIFQNYFERMASFDTSLSSSPATHGSEVSFVESECSLQNETIPSCNSTVANENHYEQNRPVGVQIADILGTENCCTNLNENDQDVNFNENDQNERCFVTTRKRNGNASDLSFKDNTCIIDKTTDFDITAINNIQFEDRNDKKSVMSDNADHCLLDANQSNESINGPNTTIKRKSSIILPCLKSQITKRRERSSRICTRKSSRLLRESDVSDISDNEKDVCNNNGDIVNSQFNTINICLNERNPFTTTYSRSKERSEQQSSVDLRLSYVTDRKSSRICKKRNTTNRTQRFSNNSSFEDKPGIVLMPGKKWERSLSIYRRMTVMGDRFDETVLEDDHLKGKKYRQSIIDTMELQERSGSTHNDSICSRRSSFISKQSRSTIRIVQEQCNLRASICSTSLLDDLKGFLNEDCDDTIIELSKLSISDVDHEVTVLEKVHEPPGRVATARDYVLRRCNQTDAILFDECYPDTVLKNCRKIGEGVYGEVFLWRARDGFARVMKIVPIAGTTKVNGEHQKDFHEIISEIVIAMELSALRAPIAHIERHFEEGNDVEALDLHSIENATDVFNEVLAVRCVNGSYPSRLLDLWELYDECKGSENDNPAILPVDQQYIVLELANAGQDLESYQFNNAEQAHALFIQVAFGLAVGEEAFQFEHRDLHWGNVLIAPTDQKFATFVLRGRVYRVPRRGVFATIIDYSLSRLSLPLCGTESAALYNDLATDDALFDALGDYQFEVYRLMREKLSNDWKNFEPYTNVIWLHYTVDKMITALRYKRTNTKIHKSYISKLKGIKNRILNYGSASEFVLTDNELIF